MHAISAKLRIRVISSIEKISEIFSSHSLGDDLASDLISRQRFVSALCDRQLQGPDSEQLFSISNAEELFDRANVENAEHISQAEFLQFWLAEKIQESSDSVVGKCDSSGLSNINPLPGNFAQGLQDQVQASRAALKESQSLLRHKIAQLKLESRANALQKKAEATIASCQRKIDKANTVIRTQRAVLESGKSDESAISKAQELIASAKSILTSAQSGLGMAKKQEAVAFSALVDASEAADAVDSISCASDYFEEIRRNVQLLAADLNSVSDIRQLFYGMDMNRDGRLSAMEFCTGIKALLKNRGIKVKRGGIELLCGWLDSDGSGYVDLEEFLGALSSPSNHPIWPQRAMVSFEGTFCLARYHGNGKVVWEEPGGKTCHWEPKAIEDQKALGRFFHAVVGPVQHDGRFKVAFSRPRSSASSLYHAFSDIPNLRCTIFQVCKNNDIYIHCKVRTEHALNIFIESALESRQSSLIELLTTLIRHLIDDDTVSHAISSMVLPSSASHPKSSEISRDQTDPISRALALKNKTQILFHEEHGLLSVWNLMHKEVPSNSTHQAEQNKAHQIQLDHFQASTLQLLVEKEVEKARILRDVWIGIANAYSTFRQLAITTISRNSSEAAQHADKPVTLAHQKIVDPSLTSSLNSFVEGELLTYWNPGLLKMSRPIVVQSPELYDVTFQRSPDTAKLLETFRYFFHDSSSKESLESQIGRNFMEADRDNSGRLGRTELAILIRRAVNGDKEIKSFKRTADRESRYMERLNELEIEHLVDILDANKSGFVTMDCLKDFLIPRGSVCPYDQIKVFEFFGMEADRIVVLIDPAHSCSNCWEKSVIERLHNLYKDKMVFASVVTTEIQNSHTMNEIQSIINSTALLFSQMLRSEKVSTQLLDNVFAIRISSKAKTAWDSNVAWKQLLQGSFKRFVSEIFSSEETQAISIIHMIADALRILSSCLGKSLLREHQSISLENIKADQLQRISTAASTIANFCDYSKLQVQRLILSIQCLRLQPALDNLVMTIKKSEHQAVNILRELKMDLASKIEMSKALETDQMLTEEAAKALKRSDFLQWTSSRHTKCWLELIQMRQNLKAGTIKELATLLKEYRVQDVGGLTDLGAQSIKQKLESKNVESQEIQIVLQEINLVRGMFWNTETNTSRRNLWILVREQYLRTEDLQFFYNILDGHLTAPSYVLAALQDGLGFLTCNLAQDCYLKLVEVPFTFEINVDGGKVKYVPCSRHFFTDKKGDNAVLGHFQVGQISAEAVVELLMAIRREVTHSIGWSQYDSA
jgi:Ca2+-binding EF-hand superfamily protein